MVLFYYDLQNFPITDPINNWPDQLKAERKQSQNEIGKQDLQRIVSFWNPRLAHQSLEERFREGATLWLIRSEGQLAGYGWTLTGHTMRPHYVPLGVNDVHLFDFLVFPEFRGRRINPSLVTHILGQLSREGKTRAYIEVAEWNRTQLTSLNKTGLHFFGVARKMSILGRTFVEWKRDQDNLDQNVEIFPES